MQAVRTKGSAFLLALLLALGVMGVGTISQPGSLLGPQTANAAVIGKPGCLPGTHGWAIGAKPSKWGVPIKYSVCTYRTSMGHHIKNFRTGTSYPLIKVNWKLV